MAIEPLPIEPPPIPHLVPVPDLPPVPPGEAPIITPGRAPGLTWGHIWDWVKHGHQVQEAAVALSSYPWYQQMTHFVEAYVGQAIHGLGSVVNDLTDYTYGRFNDAASAFSWTFAHVSWLEGLMNDVVGGIAAQVNDIMNNILPALYGAIITMPDWVLAQIHEEAINVEQWAMHNIFSPLIDELGVVDANIRRDVFGLVDAVGGSLADMINQLDADMLERIGLVAAIAAAAEKFVQDCGEPMCATLGPSTDLFKLLKAFEAAGILALLMEIGNMSEADVEARLRELAGDVQGIVGAFDSTFVGGGGTLRDFALSLL